MANYKDKKLNHKGLSRYRLSQIKFDAAWKPARGSEEDKRSPKVDPGAWHGMTYDPKHDRYSRAKDANAQSALLACLVERAAKLLRVSPDSIRDPQIIRESIDARDKRAVKKIYTIDFDCSKKLDLKKNRNLSYAPDMEYHLPVHAPGDQEKTRSNTSDSHEVYRNAAAPKRPVIIGMGPCGMFAGLILAEAGFRPLILERGKNVEARTEDVERFWREGILDPESNVQFGEGGAGTFSDGKLTTGIKDSRIRKVLEEFVEAGADPKILYQHKPHIGTDVLRTVVRNIREKIIALGGEIRFGACVTGFQLEDVRQEDPADHADSAKQHLEDPSGMYDPGKCPEPDLQYRKIKAVIVQVSGNDRDRNTGYDSCAGNDSGTGRDCDTGNVSCAGTDSRNSITGREERIEAEHVILAIGHSARDTFRVLRDLGIEMEQKPFSIGVRVEHPQKMINESQYGSYAKYLGAADYKLSYHCQNGRGVYTFCMCPGGEVICASSEEGGIVVNGMSNSARDGKYANSALLVDVKTSDFGSDDPLAGVEFQRKYERLAYQHSNADRTNTSKQDHENCSIERYIPPQTTRGDDRYSPPQTTWGDERYVPPQTTWGDNRYVPPQTTWGELKRWYTEKSIVPGSASDASIADAFSEDASTDKGSSALSDAARVGSCLPDFVMDSYMEAMPHLGKKLKGFDSDNTIMKAVETRSSSPVRLIRDDTRQSMNIRGLYPAGEGAGYAGGITSAAVDGIRTAEQVILSYTPYIAAR